MSGPSFVVWGDGPWGRALSRRLASGGANVALIGLRTSNRKLPRGIVHSTDLASALGSCERVLVALPVTALEAALTDAARHFEGHHRVVLTSRGLTSRGLSSAEVPQRASEVLMQRTCVRQFAVLAGASDATTLDQGRAASLVVASAFPSWSQELQAALAGPTLRVYTSVDPIGVELSNAIAVVLAVALGVAHARDATSATRATALTRAVAEMDRLVRRFGGTAGTAFGLAGLGVLSTLVFDASGPPFDAGSALCRGDLLEAQAQTELRAAAAALSARARIAGVSAPLVDTVHELFEGRQSADEALTMLMSRAARSE